LFNNQSRSADELVAAAAPRPQQVSAD